MFSKALFKQSTKANSMRWMTITLATCLMLMVIIVVLGSINVVGIRDSLTKVFTTANEEASIKENAVDSYDLYLDSVEIEHTLTGLSNGNQTLDSEQEKSLGSLWNVAANEYEIALSEFEDKNEREATEEEQAQIAIQLAPTLLDYLQQQGVDVSALGFEQTELENLLVCLMRAYAGNHIQYVNGQGQQFFTQSKEILEEAYLLRVYDAAYTMAMAKEGATAEFANATAAAMKQMAFVAMESYTGDGGQASFNRKDFGIPAAEYSSSMLSEIASYIVPAEYSEEEKTVFKVSVKVIVKNAINTYQTWMDEGRDRIEAREQATMSISDQIPEDVQKTLHDLGGMDIAGLIIGSMFYKMAGLLLPMVFVITTANGLLAGQVDSGSMAYVLSTPTKRRTVTFTQMAYLVVAVISMYAVLTVTSIGTLAIVGADFGIEITEMLLLNLGSCVTMLSIAGFCFMCSAIFNRSKHSMSLGGGLSIFFLVCTILGLFGSSAMPAAIRIPAMDAFNYFSLISLFDTGAILSGGMSYIWKLAILAVVGIVCFVIGIIKFEKKDLPL